MGAGMTTASPILLVSGWGATDRMWDALRGELPHSHVEVLAWNDALRDPSALPSRMASRPGPWLLVGWSLGAIVALEAAVECVLPLAGLVLIAGTARLCRDDGYPGVDPREVRAMQSRLARAPERVLGDFAARLAAPDGDDAIRADYLDQAKQFSAADLALGLEALATRDLRRLVGKLAVRTLLVHGDADGIVPLDSARELAARIPGARLEILPRRGHALPLTVPGELAGLIRSFAA